MLNGIDVFADERIPVGRMIRTSRAIHAHPLDVIAIANHGDPLTRLHEAMDFLVEVAETKLARAAAEILFTTSKTTKP